MQYKFTFLFVYLILTGLLSIVTTNQENNFFIQVVNVQLVVLQVFMIFIVLYNVLIGYSGAFIKRYKVPSVSSPKNKFAVLVAAHNEEAVISSILDSLKAQKYPVELYDVYVICDNCTDNTAKIVKDSGAIAMERFNQQKRGKGFALEWMYEKLWDMESIGVFYDAVIIFDADNVVSPMFIAHMNTKIENGHEVVQGYLDTKNPDDTWVTKSYSFAYWSTNRVYQLARHQLGLSAQLGGTGLAIKTSVIKQIGWSATCLTEDLEFTQRYILETGKPIGWAHEAKTYDEKPLQMGSSINQRVRWMSGRFDCAVRYSSSLFIKSLKTRSLVPFDSMIYLLSPSRFLILSMFGLFVLTDLVDKLFSTNNSLSLLGGFYIFHPLVYLVVLILYLSMPIIGVILEKKEAKLHWLFLSYMFGFSWIPVTIAGFIKRKDGNWSHTKHVRNVATDDILKYEDLVNSALVMAKKPE